MSGGGRDKGVWVTRGVGAGGGGEGVRGGGCGGWGWGGGDKPQLETPTGDVCISAIQWLQMALWWGYRCSG